MKQREIKFKVIVLSRMDGKLIEISEPLKLEAIGFYLRGRRDKDKDCIEYYEYSQDTGLKDKNGKEIYEGYILKRLNGFIYQTIFENGRFKMVPINTKSLEISIGYSGHEPIEVIGNIYENRELLKN